MLKKKLMNQYSDVDKDTIGVFRVLQVVSFTLVEA